MNMKDDERKGFFLPETNSKKTPLKMDGWNTTFLFGFRPSFRGELLVSGRLTLFLDVPLEVGITGERINGLFHLLTNGVYFGVT